MPAFAGMTMVITQAHFRRGATRTPFVLSERPQGEQSKDERVR